MTYKNIKNKNNTANKVGVRQNNQTFNSDGWAGGINNAQGIVLKEDTTEIMNVASLNVDYIGFGNTCFDGRYMYFHNKQDSNNYIFLRYDTTKAFSTANIEAFNLSGVDAGAREYAGFIFDGRYVYGIPYGTGSAKHGLLFRYDTHASFTSAGSYTVYDLETNVDSGAIGFYAGCFDGRYIYINTFYNGVSNGYLSKFIRYDTTADFSTSGSYSLFDLSTININYKGYVDICTDGEYVYLMPYTNPSERHGNFIRYKIGETFTNSASYEVINLRTFNSDWCNFQGSCFDGRYVYLASYSTHSGTTNDRIVRYDTTLDFDSSDAYTEFRTDSTLSPDGAGYRTIFFDGRFVYLGGYYDTTAATYFSDIVIYDTWKDFTDSDSWSLFDRVPLDSDLLSVSSINFDGQYLYFFGFANTGFYGKITRHRVKIYNTINRVVV